MSVMSNLALAIMERAGDDERLYNDLNWEINQHLHGEMEQEELSYTAQEILEDIERQQEQTIQMCPVCGCYLDVEGEDVKGLVCRECGFVWF